MTGVIVNTVAVLLGSLIGLLCKKGIPEKFTDAIMKGIALCTIYIGISGTLKGQNTIVMIVSIVLGAAIGTAADLDGKLNGVGSRLEKKFSGKGENGSFARAFVTASLLFCVGAMTIVGSLTAGLTGDNQMLYTKSVLDFISSIMLTVSLGPGVLFSTLFVLVFQGSIALLAGVLSPLFSETGINETVSTGSLMIIGLGLNLLGVTKIKVADYIPAIVLTPVIIWLLEHFSIAI